MSDEADDAPGFFQWCGAWCSLLCCPPIPHRIVSKLAFAPPKPTYRITGDLSNLVLEYQEPFDPSQSFYRFAPQELQSAEVVRLATNRGNTLVGLFMRVPNATFTMLFSHGNAVDIGGSAPELARLAAQLRVNMFVYDYAGYGLSSGTPREANLYADIHAAWDCLRTRFHIPGNTIILYGQSIGTVPTIHLAAKVQPAGVILHSPLASGLRLFRPSLQTTWCCDPFPSLSKIRHIKAPILFMHGERDAVIPIAHSQLLLAETEVAVEPLWTGGGHDDVETHPDYLSSLFQFLLLLASAANDTVVVVPV